MFGSASGDDRGDAQCANLLAVDVVVVAAIGVDLLRAPARSTALAPDRRHRLDQRDQLGHVVAVAAGERGGQRDAVGLDDDMVLAAGLAAVHREQRQAPSESLVPGGVGPGAGFDVRCAELRVLGLM